MDKLLKPGFKTTEFAFTLVFVALSVLGVLAGQLQGPYAPIAVAVVTGAYAIARGMAKSNSVEPASSLPLEPPK